MKKAVIFGIGRSYQRIKDKLFKDYNVVALVDNDKKKIGSAVNDGGGYIIYSPDIIKDIDYDLVIITVLSNEIVNQLRKLGCINFKMNNINANIMEDGNFLFEHNKIKAVIMNVSDQYMFNEVFTEEEYGYLFNRKSVVIDIGMNKGIVSMYFARNDCVESVYSYEPVTYTYEKALQNFKLTDESITKKISPFNYGLGGNTEDRLVKGFTTESTGYSSTICLSDVLPQFDNVEYNISVKIKNAAHEFNKIVNEHRDCEIVCKIDAEGSEFEIIELLEKENLLRAVYTYMIEVHFCYMPDPPQALENIKKLFLRNNYTVVMNGTRFPSGAHMLYAIRREV